jgi:hypothetical protein
MWFLFQSGIIVATVQSNISWHWAERTAHAVMIGVGLAWLGTVVAGVGEKGHPTMKQQLRANRTPRGGHLGTALFWTALLGVFSWQASAQIPQPPRPPLPIPNVVAPPRPPAIRMAAIPAPVPAPERPAPPPTTPAMITPAIPGTPTLPATIALPPVEYDHEYRGGQLIVTKWDDYSLIRVICKDVVNPIACSYRTYNTATGKLISCLILLGPVAHDNEQVLRHEIGHCNGWSDKHEGAR